MRDIAADLLDAELGEFRLELLLISALYEEAERLAAGRDHAPGRRGEAGDQQT